MFQAPEAEISVLGGMLIDSATIPRAAAIVDAGCFQTERHRRLYRTMLRLHERGDAVDSVTVSEELNRSDELEGVGGIVYIAQLLDAVPTATNIEFHARIVADRAVRRAIRADASDPALELEDIIARAEERLRRTGSHCRIPRPMSITDLLALPEPETHYIADGLIPLDANVILAGYPKSHKTNTLLELMISAASATPFLGRFAVRHPFNCAAVFMEDRAHRVRGRLHRICKAHGVTLEQLSGRLSFWFRPLLRLADAAAMADLDRYVQELSCQLLILDSWSYVSTGNSDKSDDVTPQLQALARLRDRNEGLTIVLVHHARKAPHEGNGNGDRLTDLIRNSSAFGAWYDVGIVLARSDEIAPVKVRIEWRDGGPAPTPFAFTVDDEFPAGPDTGAVPSGWLRLALTDVAPAILDRRVGAERFKPAVLQTIHSNPGCSKRFLRSAIKGDDKDIEAAFELLIADQLAYFAKPEGKGKAGECYLTNRGESAVNRGATAVGANRGDRGDTHPMGGSHNHGPAPPIPDDRGGQPRLEEYYQEWVTKRTPP